MIRVAYFLIPLPEALGFDDGYTLTIRRHLPPSTLDRLHSEYSQEDAELFRQFLEISTSIKLWHSPSEWRETDMVGQLFRVAHKAVPNLPEPESSEGERTQADTTIAELFVPVEASEAAMSEAFDRALRHVQELQRAYYVVTRRPVTLVTREKLPPVVPFGLRTVTSHEDIWPSSLSLFQLNMNVTPRQRHAQLTKRELEKVVDAMDVQPGYRVFASFLDLWRHARNSLDLDGDYRAAAVFAAVSAEVLLDDLLAHLVWEEGTRPESAAVLFDGGLTKRVRTSFHTRIGGAGWDGVKDGPVRNWLRKVAGLRHRVVHAAVEPTITEARDALAALHELQSFIAERLTAKNVLTTYPRTALSLVGRPGLKRRGLWTEQLKALQDDPNEPHWVSTFARWKSAMQRCRADAAQVDPPSESIAKVVAVVLPRGVVGWVLHDQNAGMACRSAEPELNDNQWASLRTLIDDPASNEPISVSFEGANPSGLKSGDWVHEYRLMPLLGVMVSGSDLDIT